MFDFGNGAGSDNIVGAETGASNKISFHNFDGRKSNIIELEGGFDTDTWHHWAFVTEGVNQRIYRDGV